MSCCHVSVEMPGLNKVARKLSVDCAPAMVGWDFHAGFNHPMYVVKKRCHLIALFDDFDLQSVSVFCNFAHIDFGSRVAAGVKLSHIGNPTLYVASELVLEDVQSATN